MFLIVMFSVSPVPLELNFIQTGDDGKQDSMSGAVLAQHEPVSFSNALFHPPFKKKRWR